MSRVFEKYVSANQAFFIDWSLYLADANDGAADTLATSVWQADSGITVVTSTNTTTRAKVRVSGGTAGTTYRLENTITLTSSGYTDLAEILIRVKADPIP